MRMKKAELDLYTDYLLSTFGAATATGLSAMVDGEIGHDQVTRLLSKTDYASKELWQQVKSVVRCWCICTIFRTGDAPRMPS